MARRRLLHVVAFAASIVMLATGVAAASTTDTSVHAAQATGATPFDSLTQFCTKSTAPPGTRNASNPGVTKDSITISDFSLDTEQLKKIGVDQMNFHEAMTAFWNEINKCGGINGRKIILKSALFNTIAPDLQGHLQSICLKVTEDQKAFAVLGITGNFSNRCISVQHKTIAYQSAYATADEFADSKGRIVSLYPATDKLAAAFVKDAAAQGTFKGHKVAVIAPNVKPTDAADHKAQYIDNLKAVGVDADLEMLPCISTTCTQGMGAAVRRMKQNDVDMVILSPNFAAANVGPMFREFMAQGFKAAVVGPDTDALMGDSTMASMLRSAGNDGAAWAAKYGWSATGFEVRNGWRTGQVKESAFSKMCTATLAKALNQRQYQFNAQDIGNARWQGTTNICAQVRQFSRAIYSLGNNVTTERMVAALRNLKAADVRRDTSPYSRPQWLFMEKDVSPTQATDMRFAFPCPLPTPSATTACMLPVDRPARIRKL